MINLPPKLTPSELLSCEELPPFVDELLRGSRSRRREGRLTEAERYALDVIEASQEPDAIVSQAAALIHLADVHREMGRLGPALADCERAHPIFQRQSPHCQRHNEAVAAYALGLVHQLLGSEMDALKWYREAGQLFERAREHWATVNAQARVETCIRIRRWMETLSEYLTVARTRIGVNLSNRVWVPIILSEGGEPGFAMAELEIDEYTVGDQLTVDGESFRMQPLKGGRRISLAPDVECYARGIPDEARASLGASEGDYALIRREGGPNQEGPGVLETLGGPKFGNFERDDKGNINFIGSGARVIGGGDIGEDLQVGYIAALLRPAAPPPPKPPAPPPPRPPAPPPPGPSADSTELYNTLIRMVGGDKETADSLIEYERERTPDASLWELIDSAIVRLTRDRR
jgi:tetratricopeptide (TPR) repeat protein